MRVCIIGTGYVGLVTGTCLAEIGHEVVCIDKDREKIASIQRGAMPIYEPGLDALVGKNLKTHSLRLSSNLSDAINFDCNFFFIAVGTPSRPGDGSADLSHVYSAVKDIALALKSSRRNAKALPVIVVKSTVPVGTGKRVFELIARHLKKDEFAVASNPEFLREGNAIGDFMAPDRIVIGSRSAEAKALLRQLYAPLTDQSKIPVVATDVETAEMIKYAANAFLATKISFINDLSRLCEKVGAEVEDLALGIGLDKRIGDKFLKPGPGYGGSCFPKDTLALIRTAVDFESPLGIVEAVVNANTQHKKFMNHKIKSALGGSVTGANIAVLGLAFKAQTDDVRDSPALDIVAELRNAGANIKAYDPVATRNAMPILGNRTVNYANSLEQALAGADAAVLVTEWAEFKNADWKTLALRMKVPLLIDLRNVFTFEDARAFGLNYISLGRSPQMLQN